MTSLQPTLPVQLANDHDLEAQKMINNKQNEKASNNASWQGRQVQVQRTLPNNGAYDGAAKCLLFICVVSCVLIGVGSSYIHNCKVIESKCPGNNHLAYLIGGIVLAILGIIGCICCIGCTAGVVRENNQKAAQNSV